MIGSQSSGVEPDGFSSFDQHTGLPNFSIDSDQLFFQQLFQGRLGRAGRKKPDAIVGEPYGSAEGRNGMGKGARQGGKLVN